MAKPTAVFRKVRKRKSKPSEAFRTVPKASESEPEFSERTPEHVLTVREVAKIFENKGVPRTERSIVNWCHPNRHGFARLDGYYDENEGKYYITPLSVDRVIAEEQNKLKKKAQTAVSERFGTTSETELSVSESFGSDVQPFGNVPKGSERTSNDVGSETRPPEFEKYLEEMQQRYGTRDLLILNRVKDAYITKTDRRFAEFLEQLKKSNQQIGRLENQLLQLKGGEQENPTESEHDAATDEPLAGEIIAELPTEVNTSEKDEVLSRDKQTKSEENNNLSQPYAESTR